MGVGGQILDNTLRQANSHLQHMNNSKSVALSGGKVANLETSRAGGGFI